MTLRHVLLALYLASQLNQFGLLGYALAYAAIVAVGYLVVTPAVTAVLAYGAWRFTRPS